MIHAKNDKKIALLQSEEKEDFLIRSSKKVKTEDFNQLLTNEEMPPCGSPPGPV